MRSKRSLASVVLELAAVLLVTVLAFAWGMRVAQTERSYNTLGGEHIFLLIPAMYYIGKRVIQDWIADIRKLRKEGHNG